MSISEYKVDLPDFAGPLDLLLYLIERQELDITAISLQQVTTQYLAQIEQLQEERVEYLVDFLVIAARLVLIKSRALLPQTPPVPDGEEAEEDPAEALVRLLRQYKRFKDAARWLRSREEKGLRTYLRVAPPPRLEGALDLSGVTLQTLINAVQTALDRIEQREESVNLVRPRRITIEGQIKRLRQHLRQKGPVLFQEILPQAAGRLEIAVTLLAVLELIKRREVRAWQTALFGPIEINLVAAGETDETAVDTARPMPANRP
jgi:segregation and condensation protein A